MKYNNKYLKKILKYKKCYDYDKYKLHLNIIITI